MPNEQKHMEEKTVVLKTCWTSAFLRVVFGIKRSEKHRKVPEAAV